MLSELGFLQTNGEGESIILLHASPYLGKILENFGKTLDETFQVIIPNLPNYDFSEVIP